MHLTTKGPEYHQPNFCGSTKQAGCHVKHQPRAMNPRQHNVQLCESKFYLVYGSPSVLTGMY
jgi:hypothetical protein